MKDPEYKDDFFVDEEVTIDFSRYWKRIRKGKKKIFLWAAGGFVAGCLIALSVPHRYLCISKLAPELSNTATNRLSSMATMLGLSAQMLGTTDAVYPMVYPDVVKSPDFVASLFDMPVEAVEKKEVIQTTLYDYILNHRKMPLLGRILFLPGRAIGYLADCFGKEPAAEEDAPVNPLDFTREQNMVYRILSRCIATELDKKTMAVTLKVTFTDRHICTDLCLAVEKNLKDFVTRYRTEKAVKEYEYYKDLFEQVKRDYYASQAAYSEYADSHQGVILQSVSMEKERLHNEMNLNYQLYFSTAQQLQTAEAKVQLEAPVFVEIISPTAPRKSVNSRKKMALTFMLLGGFVGAAVVALKKRDEEEVSDDNGSEI